MGLTVRKLLGGLVLGGLGWLRGWGRRGRLGRLLVLLLGRSGPGGGNFKHNTNKSRGSVHSGDMFIGSFAVKVLEHKHGVTIGRDKTPKSQ